MERENVRPVEERKMDKPGDNPSSEAENRLQTLLTYQEGEMKSPFCNWGESRMKAHVSNRQLTALFLFPIIYSKGRSHGLAHGQIMTYSIQFPLVTNHHMRTHNSCVCPCQGINLVLNNNHILSKNPWTEDRQWKLTNGLLLAKISLQLQIKIHMIWSIQKNNRNWLG